MSPGAYEAKAGLPAATLKRDVDQSVRSEQLQRMVSPGGEMLWIGGIISGSGHQQHQEQREQALRNMVAGLRDLANAMEAALPKEKVRGPAGAGREEAAKEAPGPNEVKGNGSSSSSSLATRFRGASPLEPRSKDAPWRDVQREEIGISVNVKAIYDIRSTDESAKVLVEVCLIGLKSVNVADILRAIVFAGAIEQNKVEEAWQLRTNHLKAGLQAWAATFALVLHLDMNFKNYPFDVQDLILKPCAWTNGIKLVEPMKFWALTTWTRTGGGKQRSEAVSYSRVLLLTSTALVSEEWYLAPPLWNIGPADSTTRYGVGEQMNIHLKVVRKGWGFIERIAFSLGLISLTAFLPLLSPQVNISDTLSFEVVVLFTMIAYQNIVSSYVPVTSTRTILDEYTLMLFGFVLLLMLSVTIFSRIYPEQEILEDRSSITEGNIAVWSVAHAWFGYRITRALCLRRRDLNVQNQALDDGPLEIKPPEKKVEERWDKMSPYEAEEGGERWPLLQ